ncbi:GYD domain-containing protein [Actinomycetospora sp. NBRC 106375]|uniref:GYD domain-containing protein n=1 Tax=Actinomycetospora sp. NBRC 106375 TaxID=3032207 RepID=UPI0024A1BC30|nr:GYD domain-containing protein [Actinomycetospora sp. NBRC 106375]GLZ44318.1 GYD domain-containing protein [Actinomycetospora sp. NBRC 106375]
MPQFALFFSYTPETWAALLTKPADRTAAVREAVEGVGGTLDALWYMLGEDDGMVLFEVPDASAAAALSLAVTSSGSFSSVRTAQLIAAGDLPDVLTAAGTARGGYRRPGD